MSRRALSVIATTSAALALGGCVSLFPTAKPVQLYELSPRLDPAPASGHASRIVNVRLGAVGFEQASAGDRLLTVRDGEAAYIAGARWVSPAATLFDQDLKRAFAEHGSAARLLSRGDAASAQLALTVDVEAFRVRYGADGAATVETVLRAQMIRFPERTIVFDRRIAMTRKADENRVSAIVKAYDEALGAALTNLVEGADEAAAATATAG